MTLSASAFLKNCLGVTKGHPRSQIMKKVKFRNLLYQIVYIDFDDIELISNRVNFYQNY